MFIVQFNIATVTNSLILNMKKISRLYLFTYLFFVACITNGQNHIHLSSPDKNINFLFKLSTICPKYEIRFKSKTIVNESSLGLVFKKEGLFQSDLQLLHPIYKTADEFYDLVVGKIKNVHSQYNEVILPLQSKSKISIRVNLIVRVFNDAVAFRFEFPSQTNWKNYSLIDELTTFNLAQNPKALTLFRENFTTSHEGFYTSIQLDQIRNDTLMDLPTLFQYPSNVFVAITEADLRDYAGMYLIKNKGILKTALSPLPGQKEIKVNAILPHQTPWRVMMISDRIGSLIESNVLTNLCEPNIIKDVSWIKPGKTTFPWWNGSIVPDTTWPGGNNFETNKYYIDFCAANHIQYHSVVEYGLHEWYVNDGASFMPGPHADPTTAVAGLDIKEICNYAHSKGVGIRVWVHWKALYPVLEKAFTQYEAWGLSGLMVDFMDRDDQLMVNIYEEVLTSAARHHLHIQFHGAHHPSGLHRTFPNEFNREGTYNYETNKWNPTGLNPDHDLNMPFTRMLAGPTDYHLGGFRAVIPEKFKTQQSRPLMIGTRCHMLGMYVVLENYLPMVCDYPAAYLGEPGFEFLQQVPSVWDETKVIDAKVGEYILIARRKGNDWYLGGINNNEHVTTLQFAYDFLTPGDYNVELYEDASDVSANPNHLRKKDKSVTSTELQQIYMAIGGGVAIRIVKK